MRGFSRESFGLRLLGGQDDFVYNSNAFTYGPGRLSWAADISDALSWPTGRFDALSWPTSIADALSWPADIADGAASGGADALTLASVDPMAERLSILPNTIDYWW